jgi:hypothetical protein
MASFTGTEAIFVRSLLAVPAVELRGGHWMGQRKALQLASKMVGLKGDVPVGAEPPNTDCLLSAVS